MAQEGLLEQLRAELSCPVCLDLLTDPVTLDCGHHCCASCLQQRWQDLLDILPCPVCQHHCAYRKLQKNSQLSALADMVKQLPSSGSKRKQQQQQEQDQPLCEQHQQVLSLFCEQDLQLVCVQCRVSCEQQGHSLTSIEEAAAEYRKKLKSHLQILKKQLIDAHKGLEMQILKKNDFIEKFHSGESELRLEFDGLKQFFKKEFDLNDYRLTLSMTSASQNFIESKRQILACRSVTWTLLRDLHEMNLQTDLHLLLTVRSLQHQLSRCEGLEIPTTSSYKFDKVTYSLPPHYFGLQNMLSKFHTDLTLDPETAHQNITITHDRNTATFSHGNMAAAYSPDPNALTSHPAVLSSEGFDSGRHFWMVEIRDKGVWSLGVCKKSFPRDALTATLPHNGCWQLQQSTCMQPYAPTVQALGVFLDYELGEISFYDWNNKTHLCTLTDTFTGKLMPYFSATPTSLTLTMSLIKHEC